MIRQSDARDIQEIAAGISGIATILEENMARRGCEGEEEFLTPYLEGSALYAIRHLADQAGWLAERGAES